MNILNRNLEKETKFYISYAAHAGNDLAEDWLNGDLNLSSAILGEKISDAMPRQIKKYFT